MLKNLSDFLRPFSPSTLLFSINYSTKFLYIYTYIYIYISGAADSAINAISLIAIFIQSKVLLLC